MSGRQLLAWIDELLSSKSVAWSPAIVMELREAIHAEITRPKIRVRVWTDNGDIHASTHGEPNATLILDDENGL